MKILLSLEMETEKGKVTVKTLLTEEDLKKASFTEIGDALQRQVFVQYQGALNTLKGKTGERV